MRLAADHSDVYRTKYESPTRKTSLSLVGSDATVSKKSGFNARYTVVVNKSRTYPVAFAPAVTSLVFVQRFKIVF